MTKVKICGLTRPCDIAYVNEAKPDYIGFVFAPSRRQVTVEQAAVLRHELAPEIKAVGVFVNENVDEMVRLVDKRIIDIIQLHGVVDHQVVQALRERTDAPVIQAFSITNKVDLAVINESDADYYLLDYGKGGTGQTFDWGLLDDLNSFRKPVFLAGGVNAQNAATAVQRFRPYAIDTSSGVETDGVKDKEKIAKIIRRIRNV